MLLISQKRFQLKFCEPSKHVTKFPGSALANYPSGACSYEVNFLNVPKHERLDNSALWNSDDLTPILIILDILLQNKQHMAQTQVS